ncbi:D-amino-acid transaminase [Sporolactobacillus shoreicorticis]|uniref:D-alanine aminotransferase n=1 Tax=Sporolactobacillus shoreicorticis TaxID=1923877 RepID=A0ABW5S698_9BACL|nr:D-amino-acid transaminase [Sporolactobacillus shoreicorticis]MCO7125680.1 D-amino-acid transaminase [Sporolactobacillus shoreicorticis]
MAIVLYQDQFIDRDQAKVDIEDRGYQFGDGIYEALMVYSGRIFLLEPHMKRLERSARELDLALPYSTDHIIENIKKLIELNHLDDGVVYFQITRGAAARQHFFPENTPAVITGTVAGKIRDLSKRPQGIKAILADDIRWLRCDIKTLNLLGNVLAKQKAHASGAGEAILHREAIVTEGSSSNVFIVKDGTLVTHPADHYILNGITRLFVFDLAKKMNIPLAQREFTVDELLDADEVFITSTSNEVNPVLQIDDRLINGGEPGRIEKKLIDAYDAEVERIRAVPFV